MELKNYAESFEKWVKDDRALVDEAALWGAPKKLKDGFQMWLGNDRGSTKCALIKVSGEVEGSMDDLRGLLHTELIPRQHEWQHSFVDGRIVEASDDRREEVLMMAYSAGRLAQTRDCVYVKVFREWDGGFICTYRSVDHRDGCVQKGRTRLQIIRGCHMVERLEGNKLRLTTVQQATPGGLVPVFISNIAQPGILLEECKTIRKLASSGSLLSLEGMQ